jgi:putative molybdopterin biosynthesis protein
VKDQVYTVQEVADYLKVSKSKMYALVQAGEIPCVRTGRNVRILDSDLQNWLQANRVSSDQGLGGVGKQGGNE